MFSVDHILATGGLLAVGFIVFAESGLLIGFILPGDTLLFSAGIFAAQDKLPLVPLLLTVIISAIIGYEVGYKIGQKAGPHVFKNRNSVFFNPEYVERSEKFFGRHGGKAIILARFVAVVRTLISVMAGASNMDRRRYHYYNIVGATLWGGSVTMLGYWLGNTVPNVEHFILPVVLLAIAMTAGVPVYHVIQNPRMRKAVKTKIMNLFGRKPKAP